METVLTDMPLTLTDAMLPRWLPVLSAAGMHSCCLLSLKPWAEHLDMNSALIKEQILPSPL